MQNYTRTKGIYVPSTDINDFVPPPTGAIRFIFRDAITGRIKDIADFKNLLVTTGKYGIADSFRGNVANNRGQPTFIGLGTSSSAVVVGDTALHAEYFRKAISIRSVSLNIATFQTFFDQSEGNGTIAEVGLFGDNADVTANSGVLYNRALVSKTKTSSDTLTITWAVTFG